MREWVEIVWIEVRLALSWERKCPTAQAKQNHMRFSPKIQQLVRSIECSEGSPNLINTIFLRDNIEKKIRTILRVFVSFPMSLGTIYR